MNDKKTIQIKSTDLLYITYLLKRESMSDYLDHEDRVAIKQLINEINE
jgi:hypothetical protein